MPADRAALERSVEVPAGRASLAADITLPARRLGVVLFAHGSGSGRHSPRNRFVARQLQGGGLATVLADLLTVDEERADAATARYRFDIPLLAERVVELVDWAGRNPDTQGLPVGLFGASTGAAAALEAAAARPSGVGTVVSRGGRPDLAQHVLHLVRPPTLLIVGERDEVVLEYNRQAMAAIAGEARLEIVPGATHLFEEPGALEQVAELARDWFVRYLGSS